MKLLRGLTSPFHDETLTSWLYRLSLKRRLVLEDRDLLLARPKMGWSGANAIIEDLDFDFSSTYFKRACASLTLSECLVRCFFRSGSIVPVSSGSRIQFCSRCLRDDIASGQMPGWRKSWCARDAVVCAWHGVDLSYLQESPTFHKGWDAYVQSVQPVIVADPWLSKDLQALRRILINRIRLWTTHQNKNVIRLFFQLYAVFLLAPTYNYEAGVARLLFRRRATRKLSQIVTFQDSIFYGVEFSDAQARFGSKMLAAYILDGIRQVDFSNFRTCCLRHGIAFPEADEVIQLIHFGCATLDDYQHLHHQFGRFPRARGSKLDQLFTRFEKNIGSRIFYSSLRFGH